MPECKAKVYVPFMIKEGAIYDGVYMSRPNIYSDICAHCVTICNAAAGVGQLCDADNRKDGLPVVFILIRRRLKERRTNG